jgi:hypothetical protein
VRSVEPPTAEPLTIAGPQRATMLLVACGGAAVFAVAVVMFVLMRGGK